MDISDIKSSLKAIIPGSTAMRFAWLEALQDWSDDDLETVTAYPVQLDDSDEIKGDTIAIDIMGSKQYGEQRVPIPKSEL